MSSAAERELLEQEIARLTGAINQRSTSTKRYPTTLQNSQANARYPSYKRNRALVNTPAGAPGSSADPGPSVSVGEASKLAPAPTGWVSKTHGKGNKSLMSVDTYASLEKARLARETEKRKFKRMPKQIRHITLETSSVAGPSDQARRVVIDGATFEFDKDGQRLKRIEEPHSPGVTQTPFSLSMSGHQYIRTKSGNLIAAEVVRKRRSSDALRGTDGQSTRGRYGKAGARRGVVKSSEPCRYFTKTGHCNRASTCPFVHDPDRLAICPKFMRGKCPFTATTCSVSHSPNAHNAPSCAHFQKTGSCRNGDACLYPHVRVADDAPVCQAFANEGSCDKGKACDERHAWECREYSETGECSKGIKCGLMHVLRAKPLASERVHDGKADEEEKPSDAGTTSRPAARGGAGNSFDGQDDFIQFSALADKSSGEDSDGSVSSEGEASDVEA